MSSSVTNHKDTVYNNNKTLDEKNVDKQNINKNNWNTCRKNEYNGLTEKESDKIPFDVYEHILKQNTPWKSFRDYLLEDDKIKREKMFDFRLLKKEPEDEWITHPITGEYYNKTELHNDLEYYRENNCDTIEIDDEHSDWEDDYENYESSDDEEYYDDYFTDDDEFDY